MLYLGQNQHNAVQRCKCYRNTPGDITGSTVASIKRAFNVLDSTVYADRPGTNFRASDANHLNTRDLVAGHYVLNISCYADGIETRQPNVSGWTTQSVNYVYIYTPYLPARWEQASA